MDSYRFLNDAIVFYLVISGHFKSPCWIMRSQFLMICDCDAKKPFISFSGKDNKF